MNQTGSKIAKRRQSVSERRGRREGRCTGTIKHQGLVDVPKSVDFMIGTLKSCFQLIFDSLQVLDMAGGYLLKGSINGW